MIVGLVRPGVYPESWNDFEFEYAHFLAQQLVNDTSSTLLELDFDKQLATADIIQQDHFQDVEFQGRDGSRSRSKLLTKSQIWELYTLDILVLDIKLRCDQDLENLDHWVDAVRSLSKLASNSSAFELLNQTKQVYPVVTAATEDRARFELAIQAMLTRIGFTRSVFFFRAFNTPLQTPPVSPSCFSTELIC